MKNSRVITIEGNEKFIRQTLMNSIPIGHHTNNVFLSKENSILVEAGEHVGFKTLIGLKHCFHGSYKADEELEEALDRVEDMYRTDDDQAWKEAERFLIKHGRTKYV